MEVSNSIGIAQRARHPDELKKDDGKWLIDIEYYLSQQVLFRDQQLLRCFSSVKFTEFE